MILFNFEVLARPAHKVTNRLPEPEGIKLWKVFHEAEMGRLMLIVNETDNVEHLETWLKREGIKAFQYQVLDTDNIDIKVEKIHQLSSAIGRASWYIDNDPATCARTLQLGIPSIMAGTPYIIRPEWSSNTQTVRKGWSDLVDELNTQAELRAEKSWGEME